DVEEAGGRRVAVEEEEEGDEHQNEVEDRQKDVPCEGRRLADDLVREPVRRAQEEVREVDRELLEHRRDPQPEAADARAADLIDELQELALLHRLLQPPVGARRLPYEERAEEE